MIKGIRLGLLLWLALLLLFAGGVAGADRASAQVIKQITQYPQAGGSALNATDNLLLQQGPTGTAYTYGTIQQLLNVLAAVSIPSLTVSGTVSAGALAANTLTLAGSQSAGAFYRAPASTPGAPAWAPLTQADLANLGLNCANAADSPADLSTCTATSTQTGGAAQGLGAHFAEIIDLKSLGAQANAIWVVPNPNSSPPIYGATMTSGSAVLTTTDGPFTSSMVGEKIDVVGAGASGGLLATTVASHQSADQVTLASNAQTSVPSNSVFSIAPDGGTITASYAPGDVLDFASGTYTSAGSGTLQATTPAEASIAAAGSGGTNGSCTVEGTFGSGTAINGVLTFTLPVTISGGEITAVGAPKGSVFTTNPTTLTGLAVSNESGCGSLTGATVNIMMGPSGTITVTAGGAYSVFPTSPLTQTNSPASGGTGALFSLKANQSGEFLVGTDDSGAINAAVSDVNAWAALGIPACIYAPPGNYGIFASSLTQFGDGVPGCVVGSSSEWQANFIVQPSFSGPVFSADNVSGDESFIGSIQGDSTWSSPGLAPAGTVFANLKITCDRNDPNEADGIDFFDAMVYVLGGNLTITGCPGRGISVGALTKNEAAAYMAEARFFNIRLLEDGTASLPTFELSSVGSSQPANEIMLNNVDIYAPYGVGMQIHSAGTEAASYIRGDSIRIEGSQTNPTGNTGDLLEIGDSSNTTATADGIQLSHLDLIDAPLGGHALGIYAGSVAAQEYNNRFAGNLSGGIPYGNGINAQAGRTSTFDFTAITVDGYDVTVGPNGSNSGEIGAGNLFESPNLSSWTWNIASGSNADMNVPAMQPSLPSSGYLASTGAWQLPAGTEAQQPSCSSSYPGALRYDTTLGAFEGCVEGAWAELPLGAPAGLLGIYSFTSSNSDWTPPSGTGQVRARLVGSGGCGGAAQATGASESSIGGGGGAGSPAEAYETSGLTSLNISIGAAPSCVSTTGANTAGNETYVQAGDAAWEVQAYGGKPGFGSGVLSAAGVETGGGPSTQATANEGGIVLGSGSGGTPAVAVSATLGVSGQGGSVAPWGAGGAATTTSGAANACVGYGAGGGGAFNGPNAASAIAGGTPCGGEAVVEAFQ